MNRKTSTSGSGRTPGCSNRRRTATPRRVPSGSRVHSTLRPLARSQRPRRRIWVVLPDPSTPSNVMSTPFTSRPSAYRSMPRSRGAPPLSSWRARRRRLLVRGGVGGRDPRLGGRGRRLARAQEDTHTPRVSLDPVRNLAGQLDHQPGDVRAELPTADRLDRIDVDRQGAHRPVIQGVLKIENQTVWPVHELAPIPRRARRLDVDPDAVTPGLDAHVDQLDGRVGRLSRRGSGPEGEREPERRPRAAVHARSSSIRKYSHVTRGIGTGVSDVADRLALGGLSLATPPALEDIAGEVTAAEAERDREGEHEPAEEDAEGDHHRVATDPDLGERGREREQEHEPPGGAGQEARLGQSRVDRGDQHSLAEEVR